jgi:TRAP-type C4-dicarboxylate transport system permease small subunit
VYDKLAESTNAGAKLLEVLGSLVIITSILFPIAWYGHQHITPDATDWSNIWPIALSVFAFVLGLMSLALGYGLFALCAILKHLGGEGRSSSVIRSKRSA